MLCKEHLTILRRGQEYNRLLGFRERRAKKAEIVRWNIFKDARNDAQAVRTRRRSRQSNRCFRVCKTLQQPANRLEVPVAFPPPSPPSRATIFPPPRQFSHPL